MKRSRFLPALAGTAVILTLLSSSLMRAEERWSKIRLQVPERETLHKLIRMGVDFEGSRGQPGGLMECLVSESVLKRLQDEGITSEILIEDLAAFYALRLTQGPANAMGSGYGSMGGYYTFDEIRQQLDTLRLLYPRVVGVRDSIGATLQGRPIWAVRMTANPDVPSNRPQVLYFAMVHPNEPIGMMVLLHTMWQLAQRYGVDQEVTYLLDNRDLWFVPIVNADGYEANRRMRPAGGGVRRKNMRDVVTDGDDRGVNLARNWDSHWGIDNIGSSSNPGGSEYRGVGPFSEPESQVMRDFCSGKAFRFVMEYHAFMNSVFSPPGYNMNIETADSLLFRGYLRELTSLNHYSNGMTPSSYPVNGWEIDWLYENPAPGGRTFPFLVEVGNDLDGMWPATARILPLASENLEANLFAAWAAGACPRVRQILVSDSSGDGDLEPGEAFTAQIMLHNFGQDVAALTVVRLSSAGSYLDLPIRGVGVEGLGPHADTIVTMSGRVAAAALEGIEDHLIVSVSPARQVEFHDTVTVVLGQSDILFSDGGENGLANWTAQATWGLTQVAHSGNWSFTDSPNSNYRNSHTSVLSLAAPINLPSTGTVVRLQFWARWSTEPGWDYAQAQASTDGGRTWLSISGSYASQWSQVVYTGWEPLWVKEDIDLSHLAGQNVLLGFRFVANGLTTGEYFANGDGLYVDDIVVRSYTATGSRLNSPEALQFTPVALGEQDTMALVLTNVGTSALTISNLYHSSSDFSLLPPPTLPLTLPGRLDSVVFAVVFNPASEGTVQDTLLIVSNDPAHPSWGVPLSGVSVRIGQADRAKLYAASTSPTNSLFTLDMVTAETTSIGPLGTNGIVALSAHPQSGQLYGMAQGSGLLNLYRLSSIDGQTLPAATVPLSGRAMAFSPAGDLYIGTANGYLCQVDISSGDTTLVGRSSYSKYSAFAFHPTTGELWAGDLGGTKDSILKVDPVTGRATAIGRTGDGQMTTSLAFDAAGNLFALKGSPTQKTRLVRIDQSSGMGTLIGTTSVEGIIAIAMWSTPTTDIKPQPVADIPRSFKLEQNYPNPFNPSTTITYELPKSTIVTLAVFDILGREVAVLESERREAGIHEIKFDGSNHASGVYIYRLTAGDFSQSRRLMILR